MESCNYFFPMCCNLVGLIDTYFVLVDGSGNVVASDDDSVACAPGSEIYYVVPLQTPCQQYTLREGCADNSPCSGTTGVVVVGTAMPTSGRYFNLDDDDLETCKMFMYTKN